MCFGKSYNVFWQVLQAACDARIHSTEGPKVLAL